MAAQSAEERFLESSWLSDLDATDRRAVFSALVEEHAPVDAILLEQGSQNDRLLFLIEGAVKVLWSYPDGHQSEVTRLSAPAVFGVPSFFRPMPPTVSVVVTEPASLLTLSHSAHERLRKENPRAAESLALAALRELAERFDILDHRISEYVTRLSGNRAQADEWSKFRAKLFNRAQI